MVRSTQADEVVEFGLGRGRSDLDIGGTRVEHHRLTFAGRTAACAKDIEDNKYLAVEESFVPTVFTHNRDRLIIHDGAGEFLRASGQALRPTLGERVAGAATPGVFSTVVRFSG